MHGISRDPELMGEYIAGRPGSVAALATIGLIGLCVAATLVLELTRS
jgi:hypothetical protein